MKKIFIALALSLFVSSLCFAEGVSTVPVPAQQEKAADTQAQSAKKESWKIKKHKNIKKKTGKRQDAQKDTKETKEIKK